MSEYYLKTVDRMELDIAFIDASAFYASAAISLKRIADALEQLNKPRAGGDYCECKRGCKT